MVLIRYFLVSISYFFSPFFCNLVPYSLILLDFESMVKFSRVDFVLDFMLFENINCQLILVNKTCNNNQGSATIMERQGQKITSEENHFDRQKIIQSQSHSLNKSTPLFFTLRVNGHYYISFEKNSLKMNAVKSVLWIIINYIISHFVGNFKNISQNFKSFIIYLLITQNILYILLCFVDPGTIFEDEEDNLNQEKRFCMTCSIYTIKRSIHCSWCNKCVRKYDHHCSFFGKCIGKRNLLIFYAFILVCGMESPFLFFAIVFNSTQQSTN